MRTLAFFWAGFAAASFLYIVGWAIYRRIHRPKDSDRFVREVDGSPPRWSVDHLADRVAQAIAHREPRHGVEVIETIRSTRVKFVTHKFNPHYIDEPDDHGVPVVVYTNARVVVQEGPGWERRLAWALCQRVRMAIHGAPARGAEAARLPVFNAADEAAKEVADGHIQGRADGASERGVVVAG